MFDSILTPCDLHGDSCVRSRAFPDSIHAEMAEAFPGRHGDYSPAEEAEMYAQYMARMGTMVPADDDRTPPPVAPMFPRLAEWRDDMLISAIGMIELYDTQGFNLDNIGGAQNRQQFIHEASAELVRRLEAQGVSLAA